MKIILNINEPIPKDIPAPPAEWLAKNVYAPFIRHLIENDEREGICEDDEPGLLIPTVKKG